MVRLAASGAPPRQSRTMPAPALAQRVRPSPPRTTPGLEVFGRTTGLCFFRRCRLAAARCPKRRARLPAPTRHPQAPTPSSRRASKGERNSAQRLLGATRMPDSSAWGRCCGGGADALRCSAGDRENASHHPTKARAGTSANHTVARVAGRAKVLARSCQRWAPREPHEASCAGVAGCMCVWHRFGCVRLQGGANAECSQLKLRAARRLAPERTGAYETQRPRHTAEGG